MFGVGRLGSYISRGVNTVSGSFQGGAVDIIVVEQPDGSFKSSPWYARFGKSQGVLKPNERLVRVNVNGVDTDFCMYLDNKGDALFFLEADCEEGDCESYPCLGDEVVTKSNLWMKNKSKSCNYDATRRDFVPDLEPYKGKIVPRTNSPRNRYIGLPVGVRSNKESGFRGDERYSSIEHAVRAANLLEVRWSTNLSSPKNMSSYSAQVSSGKESSLNGHYEIEGDSTVPKTYYGAETFAHSSENANCNVNETSSCSAKNSDMEGTCNGVNGLNNVDLNPVLPVSNQEIFDIDIGNEDWLRNASAVPSEISEDEQFFFSDLDEPTAYKVEPERHHPEDLSEQLTETVTKDDELFQEHEVKYYSTSSPIRVSNAPENSDLDFYHPIVESLPNMPFFGDNINPEGALDLLGRSLDSNFAALRIAEAQMLLESGSEQQQVPQVQPKTDRCHISEEIKRIISDPAVEVSLCRHLLIEGMGYEAAAAAFDAEKLDAQRFSSLFPDIVKDDKLVVRIGGLYFPWDAALPIVSKTGSNESEPILEPQGMIAVGQSNKTSPAGQHKSVNTKKRSWRIWPFVFRRSTGVADKNLSSETAPQKHTSPQKKTSLEKPLPEDGNDKMARLTKKTKLAKAPTSEQLRSLNLMEGKNVVTFTFLTTLGDQQLDARIFLWKWNTRIVISDVDGTITKSDVLGQFMPLMGYDWSQTGVTRLFSAIKENGYHLLFLSARSILQASLTRQFLINLTQDGKMLPEGPVVISPDGLFPSLYREVIRRAPHEFKITCLEDIKALYPRDHNPFYAGFGNRETDELSYLKVGIPRGKIFTINPKGQVVVNRRVDTKSYTSLHDLVHDIFPETPVTEQEDYNNWNFWRLPPPDVHL